MPEALLTMSAGKSKVRCRKKNFFMGLGKFARDCLERQYIPDEGKKFYYRSIREN